jgi:plasmid stability protein
MPTLYVKDVPAGIYRALKDRAKRNGRSLSAEVRQILEGTVPPKRTRAEVVEATRRLHDKIAKDVQGRWIDITASIREDHESR